MVPDIASTPCVIADFEVDDVGVDAHEEKYGEVIRRLPELRLVVQLLLFERWFIHLHFIGFLPPISYPDSAVASNRHDFP